jgi:hypothetical protein
MSATAGKKKRREEDRWAATGVWARRRSGPGESWVGWAKRERSEVESFLFFFQTFSNLNLSNSSKKFPKVF